mmetsp:Transcript_9665/g.29330  ORF Transcript_9665/g.29330 Transcript_9665/m.29330 type:complete len:344 (+) Transcript_9665:244-1275(+)
MVGPPKKPDRPVVYRQASWLPVRESFSPSALLAKARALGVEWTDVDVLLAQDLVPKKGSTIYHGHEAHRDSTTIPLAMLLKVERGVFAAQTPSIEGLVPKCVPPFAPPGGRSKLWLSTDSSVTPLHYDDSANYLTVLHGAKHVEFCAFGKHRARAPWHAGSPNHSDEKPSTTLRRVTLHAMDVLYLPPGYWHTVRSEPRTVATSYWFPQETSGAFLERQNLMEAVIRLVRSRLRRQKRLDRNLIEAATARTFAERKRAAKNVDLGKGEFPLDLGQNSSSPKGTPARAKVTPALAAALWIAPRNVEHHCSLEELRKARDLFYRQSYVFVRRRLRRRQRRLLGRR